MAVENKTDVNELIPIEGLKKNIEEMISLLSTSIEKVKEFAKATKETSDNLNIGDAKDIDKLNKALSDSEKLSKELAKDTKILNQLTDQQKKVIQEENRILEENFKITKDVNQASVERQKVKKKLDNEIKSGVELSKKEIEAYEKIEVLKSDQGKIDAENSLIISELNKKNKENAKESLGLISAYAKLSKEAANAKKEAKDLGATLGVNSKEFQEASAKANAMNDNLKEIDKSVGDNQRSVGDYQKAVSGLGGVFGNIISKLTGINLSVQKLGFGFMKSSQGINKGVGALKKFKIALISTGLGAIVVILGTLVAGFLSTQGGIDKVNKVLVPLKAGLSAVFGLIQDVALKLFDQLSALINNVADGFNNITESITVDGILDALKSFGEAIVENLLNRFKAVLVLGDAIAELFKGNFKEAAKLGADAFIQMGTGITDGTDKIQAGLESIADMAVDVYDSLAEGVNSVTEAYKKGFTIGEKIFAQQLKLRKLELELTTQRAKLNAELENLREQESEQGVSLRDRIKLLKEVNTITDTLESKELNFLREKITLMKLEQSLNDTSPEEKLELAGLEAELFEKNAEASRKRLRITKQIVSMENELLKIQRELSDLINLKKAEAITAELEKRLAIEEIGYKKNIEDIKRRFEGEEQLNELLIALKKEHESKISEIEKQFNKDRELAKQKEYLEGLEEIQNLIITGEISTQQEIDKAIAELKKEARDRELENELDNLNNQIQLRKDNNQKFAELEQRRNEILIEQSENRLKIEEETEKKRQKIYTDSSDIISNVLKASSMQRLKDIDQEISMTQNRALQIQNAINAGAIGATQSLAEEEKKQNDLRAKRERELRKQKNVELISSGLKVFAAKLDSGDPNAFASTIRDTALLKVALANLANYHDGADRIGDRVGGIKAPFSKGGDTHLAFVRPEERIFGVRHSSEIDSLGKLSNREIVDIVKDHKTNGGNAFMFSDNSKMLNEMKALNKSFKDAYKNIPVSSLDVDQIGKIAIETIKAQNRTEYKKTRIKSSWL